MTLGAIRIAYAVLGACLLAWLPGAVYSRLSLRFTRPNFLGRQVPVGYGLFPLMFCIAMLGTGAALFPGAAPWGSWLATTAGFGVLGLADDLAGSAAYRGIRGHVRALVRDHLLTTGLVKAGGGLAIAGAVGWSISASPRDALLAGLLIALAANALNLLDVRPGRACFVFLSLGTALAAIGAAVRAPYPAALALVIAPAAVLYYRDARAEAMMGDVGSNLLGASLGLAAAQLALAWQARLGLIAALVLLHILAERVSISTLIDRNPLLRRIDRAVGVR